MSLVNYSDSETEKNENENENINNIKNNSNNSNKNNNNVKKEIETIQNLKQIFDIQTAPFIKDDFEKKVYIAPTTKELHFNPRFEALYSDVQGPKLPFDKDSLNLPLRNCPTGFVEKLSINNVSFDQQFNNFNNFGFTYDPSSSFQSGQYSGLVGKIQTVDNKKIIKKRERNLQDPSSDTFIGSWGSKKEDNITENTIETTDTTNTTETKETKETKTNNKDNNSKQTEKKDKKSTNDKESNSSDSSDSEGDDNEDKDDKNTDDSKNDNLNKRRKQASHPNAVSAGSENEITIFHGKEERDYLGRTYINIPTDLKADVHHEAFLPKKRIHTWVGHTKGVCAIEFFPRYGHLLVSSGFDAKIKIWDVYNNRQCLRTILGHNKAVRDVHFSPDGLKILSTSYDKHLKVWDTETGQRICSNKLRKMPICSKFFPIRDWDVLVGCADKKILQWDTRSNQIVQEYDQHLGAVNTITFVDNNRRFVTSSDDKTIRIWEYGIPVVIKYISEPHMHSMPAITLHPSTNWFVGQSLDNQILVYSTRDRFKLHKRKRFTGHLCAGYACRISFSPDGRYIISGDCDGKLWIWDWKTSKVYKTIPCHNSVLIGCEWHPIESSRIATAGWDGAIHYWD
eukprot:TRINITY_DN3983_c0_g2_i1.p1 TRINITY_DN3983_c0_g2~~TRINITY_DN3983_c0_g2_i1.p1  ORF type:complete len:624 (+),score=247.26 TRINITY_DN3983_c0_g2_i1:132-2003(+)